MQCNTPVPDFLQRTSFCTEELKANKTRPYFKKTFDCLGEYEHTWQMEFNSSKCHGIRIVPNKQRNVLTSSYCLHVQTLETASASKYLGITISSDLSWSTHVEDVAARGSRTVGFQRRHFRACTPKVKSATYTTTARPTLQYATATWDPQKQKDIQLWKRFNAEQPGTRTTTTRTDHQTLIHARKSEVDKSLTWRKSVFEVGQSVLRLLFSGCLECYFSFGGSYDTD